MSDRVFKAARPVLLGKAASDELRARQVAAPRASRPHATETEGNVS